MNKYKWPIITMLFVLAIPLIFWWGVSRGNEIDSMITIHGHELIRLQRDIKELQLHIAELEVKNHKLQSRMFKDWHTSKVYENALKAYRDK